MKMDRHRIAKAMDLFRFAFDSWLAGIKSDPARESRLAENAFIDLPALERNIGQFRSPASETSRDRLLLMRANLNSIVVLQATENQ